MEMAQVRYFLALCEERNFTRAARRCGVAQPSLTRAIKTLETELGRPLFQRRPEGAVLTKLGSRVVPHFEVIRRCVEEIERIPAGISPLDWRMTKRLHSSSGSHQAKRPPMPSCLNGELVPTRTK
jgi:DNA-binding transcriptional LysR family regulator